MAVTRRLISCFCPWSILNGQVSGCSSLRLLEVRDDGLHRQPAGHLARGVPAHAVGHDGQPLRSRQEERVLVVLAFHADVGVAGEADPQPVEREGRAHLDAHHRIVRVSDDQPQGFPCAFCDTAGDKAMADTRRTAATAPPTDRSAALMSALEQRILIIDGAMGTMIQRHQLTEADFRGRRFADHGRDLQGRQRGPGAHPPRRHRLHPRRLLRGRAPTSSRPTPSARTAIAQADYGLEGAGLRAEPWTARPAGAPVPPTSGASATPDRPRFVAGAIGPTNRTLSLSPDVNDPGFRAVTFDEVKAAFAEQVRGLIDGGVDLLLLETFIDTLNLKAALVAIEEVFDEKGRAPAGHDLGDHHRPQRPHAVGPDHRGVLHLDRARPPAVGGDQLRAGRARRCAPTSTTLSGLATGYVSCYPNAGLPNAFGEYDETPDTTAGLLREFAESGFVNIVGGCCGTTPDHIAAIAAAVRGHAAAPPRRPPSTATCGCRGWSGWRSRPSRTSS